jgi:hypothetical protein
MGALIDLYPPIKSLIYSDTRASLSRVSITTFLQRGRLSDMRFTNPLFPVLKIHFTNSFGRSNNEFSTKEKIISLPYSLPFLNDKIQSKV